MRKIILLGGLAFVAACATTDSPSRSDRVTLLMKDVRVGEQTDKICFSSTIDGFRDNTRDSVILTRGVKDDYLVLLSGCPGLDRAQSIGLVNRGTCLRRSDRLIVSDSAFSLSGTTPIGPESCFVDEIYKWNDDAEDGMEMTEK